MRVEMSQLIGKLRDRDDLTRDPLEGFGHLNRVQTFTKYVFPLRPEFVPKRCSFRAVLAKYFVLSQFVVVLLARQFLLIERVVPSMLLCLLRVTPSTLQQVNHLQNESLYYIKCVQFQL